MMTRSLHWICVSLKCGDITARNHQAEDARTDDLERRALDCSVMLAGTPGYSNYGGATMRMLTVRILIQMLMHNKDTVE